MDINVIVEPEDASKRGWIMHYFRWDGPSGPKPQINPMSFVKKGDQYVATLPLQVGKNYCLVTHLTLGVTLKIDLDPQCRITQPDGASWPISLEIPGDQTQLSDFTYFDAGVEP